jgi:hypothetical protein
MALACCTLNGFALPASSSDYVKDEQTTYNNDDTTDAFSLVKTVACFMKNTRPELYAGQGKYVAWVEKGTCDDQSEQTTTSQGSADMTPRYEKATIESGSDARGHLIVRLWLQATDKNNQNVYVDKKIFVQVDISQGVNLAPPLGNWIMDYCEEPNGSATCTGGYGHAEVSPDAIKVYQKGMWDDGQTYRINQGAILYTLVNGEVDQGRGIVNVSDTGPNAPNGQRNFYSRFAFKPNYYLSRVLNGSTNGSDKDICYDRRIDNGLQNVWESWLYNNDASVTTGAGAYGNRVLISSGFSVKTNASDEKTRGWASYWGVWFPDETTRPADGATLYGGPKNQNNQYTYKKVTGVLNKYTVAKTNLSAVNGVPFNVWLPKSAVTTDGSGSGSANARIHWDSTQTKFVVEAVNGDNAGVNTGKLLTVTQLIQANANGGTWYQPNIWGWQEGSPVGVQLILGDGNGTINANGSPGCSGGSCVLVPRDPSSQNNPPIAVLRSQKRVLPGTSDATAAAASPLVCTGACIGTNGSYVETSNPWGSVSTSNPVTYSYNASTGELTVTGGNTQGGSPVNTGAISAPTSNWYNTQALIPSSDTTSLNAIKCSGGNQYCGWTADEKLTTSYYGFNVGPNRWDNTEYLLSGSTPVQFDAPINLTYTVNQSGSPVNGKTVSTQYQGNGQLNIPGHCIDRYNTSKSVDCNSGDWSNKFYVNDYIVPPWKGTLNDKTSPSATEVNQATMTNKDDTNKTYLVKWLRKGVLFSSQDVTGNINGSNCNGLSTPNVGDLSMPSLADWKNPADPASTNYIGSWTDPSGAPAVINGVVQSQ